MNIAFLLGAGCEGLEQMGLPSGNDFKRDTVVADKTVELIKLLNPSSDFKIKKGTFLGHNSTNILYQTIVERGLESFCFDGSTEEVIKNYLELRSDDIERSEEEKKTIREGFLKVYKKQFYEPIRDMGINTAELSENVSIFLKNTCFYSFVDSLFNTLRRPKKYNNEVSKVVKMYYAAYKSIVNSIIGEDRYNELIDSNMNITDARSKLYYDIVSCQEELCNRKRESKGLYYNIIRDYVKKHDENDFFVATTNYTCFAEKLISLHHKDIAYMHGRLDLFEDVFTKRIATLIDFSEKDYVFPHIFVQSGIKPIVSSFQIHEMDKAIKAMETCDVLIILGYGINSDDEHITNILRDRIRANGRIICLLYNNNHEERTRIEKELFCSNKVEFASCTELSHVLDAL